MKSIRSVFVGQHKGFTTLRAAVADEDGEVLPGKQSMRARYAKTWETPSPRLNFNPIRRMLAGAVGQNWDAFRSKLIQQFGRNAKAREILRYADDKVITKTKWVDGEVHVLDRWQGDIPVSQSWCDYYVHPLTRVLMRRAANDPVHRPAAPITRLDISDTVQLQKVAGIWYEVMLGSIPQLQLNAEPFATVYEPVMRETLSVRYIAHSTWELYQRYGKRGVYATHKRQLSHKELLEHGLLAAQAA